MKKALMILTLLCLLLSGCSNEKDAKIAELTKKVEQLTKQKEQSTLKEDYELQERCGKRAEEVFKKEFGNHISNSE